MCNNQISIGGEKLFSVEKELIENSRYYRSLVAIKCPISNKAAIVYGSGILIGENLVLTSAHNLYIHSMKKQLDKKDMEVYLICDGSKIYQVFDWIFPDEYKQKDCAEYDYALIMLKDDISKPKFEQFLELKVPCQKCIKTNQKISISIFGFPKLQNNYQPLDQQGRILKIQLYGLSKQVLVDLSQKFSLKYPISTKGGQSGCPVVYNNKIIGIHKGGIEAQQVNLARLVTDDLIKQVKRWTLKLKQKYYKQKYQTINSFNDVQIFQKQLEQLQHKNKQVQKKNSEIQNQKNDKIKELKLRQKQIQTIRMEKKIGIGIGIVILIVLIGLIIGLLLGRNIGYQKSTDDNKIELIVNNLMAIAKTYEKQEKFDKAFDNYKRIMQIIDVSDKKESFQLNIYKRYIQQLQKSIKNKVKIQYENGNIQKAHDLIDISLQILEVTKGKRCYQSSQGLQYLGTIHFEKQEYDRALQYFNQTLEIKEKAKGKGCLQSISTLRKIGNTYRILKNYSLAEKYILLSQEICKKNPDIGSQSSQDLQHLGLIYSDWEKYDTALHYLSQALQIIEIAKGKGCFQSLSILRKIGNAHRNLKDYTAAIKKYSASFEISEKVKGRRSYESSYDLQQLGTLYLDQLKYNTALRYLSEALQIKEKAKGKDCFQSLSILRKIGKIHQKLKNYAIALNYYSASFEISEKVKGRRSYESSQDLQQLGTVYCDQKDYDKALKYFIEALQIREQAKGIGSFQTAFSLHYIGYIYNKKQISSFCLEYYNSSLQASKKNSKSPSFLSAITLNNIGYYHKDRYQLDKSLEYLTQAIQISQASKDKEDQTYLLMLINIGQIYRDQGSLSTALQFYNKALLGFNHIKGKFSEQSILILKIIADINFSQLNFAKSFDYNNQANEIKRKIKEKDQNEGMKYLSIGYHAKKMNNWKEAIEGFQRSLTIFEKINSQQKVKQSAKQLAKCLKISKKELRLYEIIIKYKFKVGDF